MGGTVTWTGADSSNPTHHDVAANWSAGAGGTAPPAADDHVIIPNVTHDPVMQDHDTWGSVHISSGGDLDGNGKTLTLNDGGQATIFQNLGTISGNLDVTITGGTSRAINEASTGNIRTLIINNGSSTFTQSYHLTVTTLTITAGTLNTGADKNLTVAGITTIGDGSASATEATLTCNASPCSFGSGVTSGYAVIIEVGGEFVGGTGAHTMGSFKVAADNALAKATLSQGVTTINAKSNDSNKAFRIAGSSATFDDGNGTVKFTYGGTVLVQSSSKTFHNLTVDNGSCNLELVDALYVAETLLITNGTIDTKSGSSFGVQVTKHIDIHGTFTGRGSSISTGTMTIRDGATLANSGTITVTGEDVANSPSGGNWLWRQLEDDGTGFAPTAGTVHFNHASNLNGKHLNESKFYNLTLTAGTGHDVAWTPKTANTLTVSKDLTIVEGQLKRNNEADTFVVTEDVSIESGGVLGDNDETGPNTFGSLTIASGGTYKATSGTTTITSMTSTGSGDRSLSLVSGGTFTNNSGTVLFNSGADQRLQMAGTGNLYNLTVNKSDNEFITFGNLTILNNLDVTLAADHTWRPNAGSDTLTVYGNTYLTTGKIGNTTQYTGTNNWGNVTINSGEFILSTGTNNVSGIRNVGGTVSQS